MDTPRRPRMITVAYASGLSVVNASNSTYPDSRLRGGRCYYLWGVFNPLEKIRPSGLRPHTTPPLGVPPHPSYTLIICHHITNVSQYRTLHRLGVMLLRTIVRICVVNPVQVAIGYNRGTLAAPTSRRRLWIPSALRQGAPCPPDYYDHANHPDSYNPLPMQGYTLPAR